MPSEQSDQRKAEAVTKLNVAMIHCANGDETPSRTFAAETLEAIMAVLTGEQK